MSTSKRDLEVIDLLDNSTMTMDEVGKAFNITKQRVSQICKKMGYTRTRRGLGKKVYEEILRLLNYGFTLNEVHNLLSVRKSTIRAVAAENDVSLDYHAAHQEKIRYLLATTDKSYAQIAKETGVCRATVFRVAKRADLHTILGSRQEVRKTFAKD